MPTDPPERPRTGIVLSGGGARGAYEVGTVLGIVEALGPDRAPFDIFVGTSVGAINVTWLAAHAHRPDMAISGLADEWRALRLDRHLRLDLPGLVGARGLAPWMAEQVGLERPRTERLGRSLIDARPFEEIVENRIPWSAFHRNVKAGRVHAAVVTALEIATGRTTMFAELAEGARFRPSKDPRRRAVPCAIGPRHVLASAAIPFFFPSRRVGDHYYCDGGLRSNTPVAPAIRSGADRLVVVSVRHPGYGLDPPEVERAREHDYPSPSFLLGKLLDALLLDPVDYDLQVLERFNELIATLEQECDPEILERMRRVMAEARGAPYRTLDVLAFRPSEDVGHLASARSAGLRPRHLSPWLLTRFARFGGEYEADLLSFILFDRDFAEALIDMGRRDALARRDEIRAFFA